MDDYEASVRRCIKEVLEYAQQAELKSHQLKSRVDLTSQAEENIAEDPEAWQMLRERYVAVVSARVATTLFTKTFPKVRLEIPKEDLERLAQIEENLAETIDQCLNM